MIASFIIEAKYIALNLAFQQAIFPRQLVFSIESTLKDSTVLLLFDDNKTSLQLSKKVFNISKIKHININLHQIVNKVTNNVIKLF